MNRKTPSNIVQKFIFAITAGIVCTFLSVCIRYCFQSGSAQDVTEATTPVEQKSESAPEKNRFSREELLEADKKLRAKYRTDSKSNTDKFADSKKAYRSYRDSKEDLQRDLRNMGSDYSNDPRSIQAGLKRKIESMQSDAAKR